MSPRANARRPAAPRCSAPARPTSARVLVERPELVEVAVRLLEVIAEHLLVLADDRLADRAREPRRDLLVQRRARPLRHRLVDGVADQAAVEPERVADGERRPRRLDQLLADELAQRSCSSVARRFRRELGQRRRPELLAHDRRMLEHRELIRFEAIESRGEERLDRRRDRDRRRVSRRVCIATICSRKNGLPPAASAMRARRRGSSAAPSSRLSTSASDSAAPSGLSAQRRDVAAGAGEVRPLVEQLRTRKAEQQDRRVERPVDDVLDEIEERRLGPVQVVEHDDERPLARERLEELPHRPERRLRLAAALGEADRRGDALDDDVPLVVGREDAADRVERALASEPPNDLGERREGAALSVGGGAPDEHASVAVERFGERAREVRLADSRRARRR